MKKSLIALLLVVALVVTVSVFAASAETTNAFAGQTGQFDAVCPVCGGEAVKWAPIPSDISSQVQNWSAAKNGITHFYLAKDSKLGSGTTVVAGETFCVNLNGYTWQRKTTGKFFTVDGGAVNIMDTSAEQDGAMDIPFKTTDNHITVKSGTVNQSGGKLFRSIDGSVDRYGGCVNLSGGTYNMTGGSMVGHVTSGGGAVYIEKAIFNMSGGTIVGTANIGGAFYVTGGDDGKEKTKLNISGTASVGSPDVRTTASNTAGAIYANKNCYVNINGGTIQNAHSTNSGGAISFNSQSVTFRMTDGTIKNCTSGTYGGAIYFQVAANTQITGGTIESCSAKDSGGAIAMTKYTPTVNFGGTALIQNCTAQNNGGGARGGGAVYVSSGNFKLQGGTIKNCTTPGAGGAVFVSGSGVKVTMTGGTIEKCTATGNGGGIYIQYKSTGSTISGGTIQNCSAANGGNVSVQGSGSPKVVVSGTALITKGTATTNGGNVFVDSTDGSTVFEMTGGKITNGTAKAASGTNAPGGTNLHIANAKTVSITGGEITGGGTSGNTSTYASVWLDSNKDNTDERPVDIALNLGGDAKISHIYFADWPADGYDLAGLNIKEDFSGSVKLYWQATALEQDSSRVKADFQKAGITVPSHITVEANYNNTATIYVLDDSASQKPVAYYDTNADTTKELATTGIVGVNADAAGKEVEIIVTEMAADDTYAYYKLYGTGMTVTLKKDTIVDYNNMDAHFVTGNFKLTALNYRNNNGALNAKDAGFTVDNAANLERLGANPVNGKRYVVIADGQTASGVTKYSAHNLKVDIDSVSIKPATAGLYYNVNITTNAKVAQVLKEYGVALDLTAMPAANFATSGTSVYTGETYTATEGKGVALEGVRSCLLTGILPTVDFNGTPSGEVPIFANAYVILTGAAADGTDLVVMADNPVNYSLKDIMKLVDANEELASNASVVSMYKTFADPMAKWGLDNINAAANAAA